MQRLFKNCLDVSRYRKFLCTETTNFHFTENCMLPKQKWITVGKAFWSHCQLISFNNFRTNNRMSREQRVTTFEQKKRQENFVCLLTAWRSFAAGSYFWKTQNKHQPVRNSLAARWQREKFAGFRKVRCFHTWICLRVWVWEILLNLNRPWSSTSSPPRRESISLAGHNTVPSNLRDESQSH